MASNIKFKRSAVQNRVPTTAQLALGELALNTYDGKLYTEINTGSAAVVEIGSKLSSLVVDGDNGAGGGDVTFHGTTAGVDLTWDFSDNSLKFADDTKAKFGTGGDLEIFHDGSHSRIKDTGTGHLFIHGSNTQFLNAAGTETIAKFIENAQVELRHDNSIRITTTADGADILGTGSLKVPVGTTAQRNSSPTDGDLRYNTTTGGFEGYSNNNWGEIGAGGIGVGSDASNPRTGIIQNRIGVGFTDLNIVGAGISVTGYGTTVFVDFNEFKPGSFHRTIHNYTATAGQTTFAGLNYEVSEKQIAVYLNGARLSEATYTATSGTTVVLDVGASVGDEVEIINIHTNSDVDRKVNTYTATAGQTTFTGLSYNSKTELDVYLNGIRLASDDFTATSGSTVVLAVGASVNDIIDIVSTGDGVTWRSTTDASGDVYKLTNVGIGTDQTPDKLNVRGNSKFVGVATFGNATFATDGYLTTTTGITIENSQPGIIFSDTNANPDFIIQNRQGSFAIRDITSAANRFFVNAANGDVTVTGGLDVSGNLSVDGVLTYDDVTNVDSIGIITARQGIHIDDSITHIGDTDTKIRFNSNDNISFETSGSQQLTIGANVNIITGDLTLPDTIAHRGDLNTKIRFPAADTFSVETAGAERLRINSDGRALVGTTAARTVGGAVTRLLQVEGTDGSSGISITRNSNNASTPTLDFGKSRGNSVGSNVIVQEDDQLGVIQFCGSDGTDIETEAAQIVGQVDGTPGSNDMPGRLVFKTTPDGSSTAVERLRITSSGKVGINSSVPSATLDIQDVTTDNSVPVLLLGGGGNSNGDLAFNSGEVLQTGHFDRSTGTFTERLRIASNGNVGIGTDAGYGDARLTVEGTAALTNNDTTLQIKDNVNDSAAGRGGNIGFSAYVNGTQRTLAGIGGLKSASGTGAFDGDLALYTRVNGEADLSERLRITSAGLVGIGTIAPNAVLHVEKSGTSQVLARFESNMGTNNNRALTLTSPTSDSGSLPFTFSTGNSIQFKCDTHVVHIDDNGKLGIGIDSPSSMLTIRDETGGQSLLIEGSSGNDVVVLGSVNGATNRSELLLKEGTTGGTYVRLTSKASTSNFIINNNFGIGTNSPSSELHVSALGASDEPTIKISSENSSIFLRTAGSGGSFPTGGGGDDGELTYIGGNFRLGTGTAGKNLIFYNGSGYTERVRINSTGHMGVGTNNPQGRLHISSGTANADCELIIESDTDNNDENSNPRIVFKQDGGVAASAIGNESNVLRISNGIVSGGISFRTTSSTGYTNATERMKIASDGQIDFEGNVDCNSGLDVTGNITVSGTVDGRDVASDGSKLDGIESGATADQTASEILTLLKTVDGSGSGLDADTLDGITSGNLLRSDTSDTMSGNLEVTGNVTIGERIVHRGDTNTHLKFPSNDTIVLATANVERLRINSAGNIGINATPRTDGIASNVDHFLCIGDTDTGIAQDGDGQFEIWANNQECANFNTSTITFTKTIQIPDTIQHTGDTNTKIRFPSNDVISFETGGTERGRFTSNGLCLGGTGSANGLDDYEEGTFTPSYTSTNNNVSGVTYDARSGRYIKIGRLVYINLRLRTDAINRGSGSIRVGGLPFTHVNATNGRAITSNIFSAGWTADNAPTQGLIQNNNTVMNLYQKEYNEDTVAMDVSRWNTGANDNDIRVSAMYETA